MVESIVTKTVQPDAGWSTLVVSELDPPLNPVLVTDGRGLEKLKAFFERKRKKTAKPAIGFDTETNFVHDFYSRRARTAQFGDRDEQYCIDLLAFAETKEKLIACQGFDGKFISGSSLQPVIDAIGPVLADDVFLKVGVYLPFDYEVGRWGWGVRACGLYSTDIVEKLLHCGLHSLKDYSFFSMEQMIGRYFKNQIDKSLQQTFDLESPLTESHVTYACLDTRLALAIRSAQIKTVREAKLDRVVQIENDAIGAFVDMHINGLRVDIPRFTARIDGIKKQHAETLAKLDALFIPVVGRKYQPSHNLDALERTWRHLGLPSTEEAALRGDARKLLKAEREVAKKQAREAFCIARKSMSEAKRNLSTYQGEAAINYDSQVQLKKALLKFRGVTSAKLPSTSDDVLKHLRGIPVIDTLRVFRKSQKELSTYGMSWITTWVNKAGVEEGWIHPGTGCIHAKINQLEAETGRSSSVQPNSQNIPHDPELRACFIADEPDDWAPEGYLIGTCDMSGAELRIIADLALAKSWIEAFAKGWDVHSVSTEILYPVEWPAEACKGGEKYFDPENGKEVELPPCAYFTKDHQKCKCPAHKKRRDGTKATNFLLCYGGGPDALAEGIDSDRETAAELMQKHEAAFPDVWGYLSRSGKEAVARMEARDMFGRRRSFLRPNADAAKVMARERLEERYKKTKDEKYNREPSSKEIMSALKGMYGSIERRGKNMPIQGTNATIIKLAMGCGKDKDGKPYLSNSESLMVKKYRAKLRNMVHDELVWQWAKRFGDEPLAVIGDAFRRAAAEVMKQVVMEYEGKTAPYWVK